MFKILIYHLAIFTFASLHAQKVVSKNIYNPEIEEIQILGDNIFRIYIETQPINNIEIKTKIEGEHSDQVILQTNTYKQKLEITTHLQPFFELENDKLSAHKIIAITLHVILPEYKQVQISSNLASVITFGKFNNLLVSLGEGSCFLHQFLGNAKVNTISGNITVHTNNATIYAESVTNNTFIDPVSPGINTIQLKSKNGAIWVMPSK